MPQMPPFNVLVLGGPDPAGLAASSHGPYLLTQGEDITQAGRHDALLVQMPSAEVLRQFVMLPELPQAAFDTAVVIVCRRAEPETCIALLGVGVQEVVTMADSETLGRGLRHAIERKKLERATRTAYATDLATGLPHQAQLIEHMTHLLALRERAPSPMALVVLRVQGFATAGARMGSEAANVLRRKVAVRLRGGLRASDVVAAVGPDSFGVLLSHLESPSHAERVAGKLVQSLRQPFTVAGQGHAVAASVGLALVPEHGTDAQALLRRASAQASQVSSDSGAGMGQLFDGGSAAAANDAL